MGRIGSALRRPWVGASVAFVVAAVTLGACGGAYLAQHKSVVGGYVSALTPPRLPFKGSSGYHLDLIRTAQGAWFDLKASYPGLPAMPPGTPLGLADFTVVQDERGWPRRTEVVWDLTINSIEPASGGPQPADQAEWRRLIAEALGHSFPGRYDLPASIRLGESHGSAWHLWAFVLNAGDRLWHAPVWRWSWLGLSALVGLLTGFVLHRNPWRAPGACRECGYDLRGLDGGVCPECGSGIA